MLTNDVNISMINISEIISMIIKHRITLLTICVF